jgi:hypothetical protein
MATVSRIIEFTPTIGGNHTKPDNEKFKVELKAVDVNKKQSQLRKFVEMDPKKLMKEMMSDNQQNEVRRMLTEHFVGFINFTIKDVADDTTVQAGVEGFVFDDITGEKSSEKRFVKKGERYLRSMTIEDVFDIGEFELAMEIFMHMIGSSQLKKAKPPKMDDEGNLLPPVAGDDKEDEEKNSESLSGSTPIH